MERAPSISQKIRSRLSLRSKPRPVIVERLCKSCQVLFLTDDLLSRIPVSTLPDGLPALDLLQGFIDLPIKRKDTYPLFPALNDAAAQGCEVCKLLSRAIEWEVKRLSSISDQNGSLEIASTSEAYITFRYNCTAELGKQTFLAGEWPTMLSALEVVISGREFQKRIPSILVIFKITCDSTLALAKYLRINWKSTEATTLSHMNVKSINEWIRECRHSHSACQSFNSSSSSISMPTRLVYIGNNRVGLPPRLVQVHELKTPFKYAALSYCWGDPSSMRLITTTETLPTKLSGISWEELPHAFKDAFIVADKLSLDFIWIDALCIVQDDKRDWEVEASKMGDIYRNAHITIVAAKSRSTNDGFLDRQKPEDSVSIPFSSKKYPQASGNYQISFSPSGYSSQFVQDIEQSKWNGRGWTFQERLLSKRLLFFGTQMMYFECRTHRRAENYHGILNRNLAFFRHLQSLEDWDLIQMSWRKLIEEYSSRAFTQPSDRLPALAGLAQELLKTWEDNGDPIQYLAGHWRNGLETDLVWLTNRRNLESLRKVNSETTNTAPSWSWCSTFDGISWPDVGLEPLCKIVNAKAKLGSSNQLGRVKGGFLDILGELTPYQMQHHTIAQNDSWLLEHFAGSLSGYGSIPIKLALDSHISVRDRDAHIVEYNLNKGPDRVWLALTCVSSKAIWGLILTEAEGYSSLKGEAGEDGYTLLATPLRRLGVFKSEIVPNYTNAWDTGALHRSFQKYLNLRKYGFRLV